MSESPQPPHEAAFFTAIRGWNIQRGPGVLGGVSSGLGARVGMAPVPARLLTVLAGLILPGIVLVAYAAGWALLPDRRGAIVIQDFGRGVTNVGALIGIAIMAVIGFAAFDNGPVFNVFGWNWDGGGPFHVVIGIFAVLIPLAIFGGLVFLIVYLVRRGQRGPVPPGSGGTTWSSSAPPAPSAASAADAEAGTREDDASGEADSAQSAEGDVPADASGDPVAHEAVAPTATPASATGTTASSRPQPWEPALLPGDPRAQSTPQPPPAASAYAWSSSTGEQARWSGHDAHRAARVTRVPGPGKAAWLAFLGVLVLSVAVVFAIERADRLVVSPVLAWGVSVTIGLGVILLVVALSGRRLGFLGFLSVCAVLISIPFVANADEIRESFDDLGGWWNGNAYWNGEFSGPVAEASSEPIATDVGPDPAEIRGAFGEDYASVYIAGSCYGTDPTSDIAFQFGTADSLVQYSTLDEDTTVALRGGSTDVFVPVGTSLTLTGSGSQTVVFPDREVYCDTWVDSTSEEFFSLANPDAPTLTLDTVDGATVFIHEEVSQ